MASSILKEDKVASTIHIINNLVRSLTKTKQTKKVNTDYFVLADKTIDTIVDMIQDKSAKSAIVVDDPGLQIVNRLYQMSVEDITLVLTRVPREHITLVSSVIMRTFPEMKITIKHIEEVE